MHSHRCYLIRLGIIHIKIVQITIDNKLHYKSMEPTGVEFSVANFIPLPFSVWDPVSKGTPATRLMYDIGLMGLSEHGTGGRYHNG